MAKGKYAERSRHKADADRRHAVAVAEGNALRRQVRELRHLRDENAGLLQVNADLRRQIAEASSERENELSELLKEAIQTMDEMHAGYQRDAAEQLRKWDHLLEELTRYPKTEAWWGAITAVSRQSIRLSDEEKALPHEALKKRLQLTLRAAHPARASSGVVRRERKRRLDRFEARKVKPLKSEALIRSTETGTGGDDGIADRTDEGS